MIQRVLVLVALLALGACAIAPPRPSAPPRSERDWLADIRAEAQRLPSNIHVMPLEEPQVVDLRTQAQAAAAAGQYPAAALLWQRALALKGDDPTLWQGLAEAELGQRRYRESLAAAERAAANGPEVGELCLRTWLAIHASKTELADAPGAAEAMHRVAKCQAAAPPRF